MTNVSPLCKGSVCATRVAFALIFSALVSVHSVSAQAPPSPWVAGDVGSPSIVGKTTYSNGTYTVSAGGVDIWNTTDQFHFVYQKITGDVDVMVRVQSLSNSNSWAKAGVMIRESLAGDSRHAFALLSASNGYAYQDRIDPGGFSNSISGVTGVAPGWVRLVRTGSQIEAFRSTNGTTWTSMGVDVVPMVATVYVGIATTSHNVSVATKAVLTNLKLTAAASAPPTNQAPTVSLTSPASGATYSAPASIALAASASDADGTVSKVEFYSGATLLGTDTTAPYTYTWGSVAAGTYTLSAVAYDAAGAKASSAGTTVTVGTSSSTAVPAPWTASDIGSPALGGSATYNNGVFSVNAAGLDIWDASDQFQFIYQAVSGDVDLIARVDSLTTVQAWTNAGVMVRASLAANSLHAYTAVTSGNGVYFRRRVSAGASTTSTQGSTSAAPAWVRIVRQGTLVTSYTSPDGSSWTAIGSQTLALSTTAYVGLAVTSHDATARTTATFSNVKVTTPSAPPSNKAPTVSLTAPAGGASYTAPASVALTASASDSDGTISKVEFYSGTTLLGTDTSAPYSYTWGSVQAGTYSLTAVAYDNSGAKSTSAAVSITVKTSTTTGPPTAVAFHASADHATVTSYRFDVFASGANPATSTPISTANLGKPTPDASGDITSNQSALFSALAVGNYQATVTAISSGGSTRSAAVAFTR